MKPFDIESFVSNAKYVHCQVHDYYKTNYKNLQEHVIVNCPHHGEFMITPEKHLTGLECPKDRIVYK